MKIEINIADQTLILYDNNKEVRPYLVSTGLKGVGENNGSEQTPRGWHIIRAKIGEGCPLNTVFVERRPTGEIYTTELCRQNPRRDWILTRILWLSGLEVGKNRLGSVDTMRRCIYIHGSPDTAMMGEPGSHGCIRMHNDDMVELFGLVSAGDKIFIDGSV